MTPIRELVIQLDSDDRVRAHQAFRKLADAVDRVTDPGAAAEREALATSLATELIATTDVPSAKVELTNVPGSKVKPLQPRHSVAARRHLCRFLSQVASDAQVAALATALNDLEVRDAARCALECIPTLPATKVLVASLQQVGTEFRVGIVHALSKQRWLEAMAALSRLASDPDPEVRLAAIDGLANFPEAANDELLRAATKSSSPRERSRAYGARLRLADTLRWAGEKRDAVAIYRSVLDEAPEHWKSAAKRGLELLKPKAAD